MIEKEAILEELRKKLEEPIPAHWRASINLGKLTELEYYSKVIVGQTFCIRQKDKLKKRLNSKFLKVLETLDKHANYGTNPFTNLAWVRDGIKREIKIYKKMLK